MTNGSQQIGFIAGPDSAQWLSLLRPLAASCGLHLRPIEDEREPGLVGVIVIGEGSRQTRPCPVAEFRVRLADGGTPEPVLVRFGVDAAVPTPFRGKELVTQCVVPEADGSRFGAVMATAQDRPVWLTLMVDGQRHDTCWVASDCATPGKFSFERLNGKRFMELLPILEWMRFLSGFGAWIRPPMRACFMFDDPNLHALRYGYVDYARLAREGRVHRYHTAFATVPFDGYYVNAAAARCFREHSDTLSLLVHGNNHTHRELAGGRSQEERLAQMSQALQRMNRYDHGAGVRTAKVMAPPHGACSEAMMEAMRDAGFEAACISPASIRAANPQAVWRDTLGLDPAAMINQFPVIPRFIFESGREGSIRLATYLHQPIIPVGHHWDLAEGTTLLAKTAGVINGLGAVEWTDLSTMARKNYRHRFEGNRLVVQPFSRLLELEVPEGVSEICLEAPWLQGAHEGLAVVAHGLTEAGQEEAPARENPLIVPVPSNRRQMTVPLGLKGSTPLATPTPKTPLSAIVRRILVELRDRSMPHLPRRWGRG